MCCKNPATAKFLTNWCDPCCFFNETRPVGSCRFPHWAVAAIRDKLKIEVFASEMPKSLTLSRTGGSMASRPW